MLKINLEALRRCGYEVQQDENQVCIEAGSNARPIFTNATYRRMYNDLEQTSLSVSECEQLVEDFTSQIVNREVWTIATAAKAIKSC